MSISVLVVEDHAEVRNLIQHMLTQRGYDVRCAATVDEAAASLRDMVPAPCIVLWDAVTLQMTTTLLAQTVRRGVHVATIPVSVTSTGQAADGSPIIAKRLTSREALLSVVREHCPEAEAHVNVG
jgi:CheY-like chemotaxis protein